MTEESSTARLIWNQNIPVGSKWGWLTSQHLLAQS